MFVYILMGGIFILSLIVQNSLKSKFAKYSKVPLGVPMAGCLSHTKGDDVHGQVCSQGQAQ